jgi:hypothetical protein
VHIGHFLERFLALYFMFSVKRKGQTTPTKPTTRTMVASAAAAAIIPVLIGWW